LAAIVRCHDTPGFTQWSIDQCSKTPKFWVRTRGDSGEEGREEKEKERKGKLEA